MRKTYWNGQETPCRRVRVRVDKAERPAWWCAQLEGTERNAVEVRYGSRIFYLDDEDAPDPKQHCAGVGWWKVTQGKGDPECYHAELPVNEVLEEL